MSGNRGQSIEGRVFHLWFAVRLRASQHLGIRHARLLQFTVQLICSSELNIEMVLSAIGARRVKEADIYPQGTANIIAAMEKYQVRRLIAITSAAVDNDPELGFVFGKIIKPLFLKNIYVGMKQLEKNVMQSDLDWTIVGPGWLTDGPHTGVYRVSDSGMPKGSRNISRADVADLMLKESTNTQHIHKKLVIVY